MAVLLLLSSGPAPSISAKNPASRDPSATKGPAPQAPAWGNAPQRWRRWAAAATLLLILGVAAWLRLRGPLYATAFADEMIEITYGRQFLASPLAPPYAETLYWHYGWYLWPTVAAYADRLGGLGAARNAAGIFGLITIVALWGFTRRMFSPAAGLAAAAIFALLGPAVFASRFATYDAAAVCFLALGLWMYARAWQKDECATWLLAAVLFFAAFLSKYIVALYFPFLVLLALRKGKRPVVFFSAPLAVFCGLYAFFFRTVLRNVIHMVGGENQTFQPTSQQLYQIYFTARPDFWILLALSLLALIPASKMFGDNSSERSYRDTVLLALCLWLGTAVIFALQFGSSAANLRFFKHVTYALLFLVPLAAEGVLRVCRFAPRKIFAATCVVTIGAVAIGLGILGKGFRSGEMVFWPSVDPAVALFQYQLPAQSRILTNDLALRYYLCPPMPLDNITGPYFFSHEGLIGSPAYARAMDQGLFDYVVLVGKGLEETAGSMQATVRPILPARYQLLIKMPDPQLHLLLEIYERMNPPASKPAEAERVEILSPANNDAVPAEGQIPLRGVARGVQLGWYLRAEVLTNRWYPQGGKIFPSAADGTFSAGVSLGSRCHHIIRVILYDERDRPVASDVVYGIARANPDGSAPACP